MHNVYTVLVTTPITYVYMHKYKEGCAKGGSDRSQFREKFVLVNCVWSSTLCP